MTTHAPTKTYVARRTAEGLSKREIMRCLKHYLVRELFRHIQAITQLQPSDHGGAHAATTAA